MHRLLILLLAFTILPPLEAAKLKSGRLAGKIKAGTYIAPQDLFRVPVPVDGDLGGRVDDGIGNVHFTDDVGHLFRIEYMPVTPEAAQQLAKVGEKVFFEQFMAQIYLPNTIWMVIPKAKLLAQQFSTQSGGPMLLSWMFLPQGSVYAVSRGSGNSAREDSYRTIAIFVRKGTLFVLSLAPSGPEVGMFGEKTPPDQLRTTVEKSTLEFASRIQFSK